MTKNYFFSRKGNVLLDGMMFIVILFIFALIIIVSYNFSHNLNIDLQADDDIAQEAKDISSSIDSSFANVWDGIFLLTFVLLWIVVAVLSFMIDTHPIFFVISIFLLVFVVIGAAYISNAFEEITGDDELSTYAVSFPMMNFIIGHLVQFVLAIIVTIMIALFGKNRFAGSGT